MNNGHAGHDSFGCSRRRRTDRGMSEARPASGDSDATTSRQRENSGSGTPSSFALVESVTAAEVENTEPLSSSGPVQSEENTSPLAAEQPPPSSPPCRSTEMEEGQTLGTQPTGQAARAPERPDAQDRTGPGDLPRRRPGLCSPRPENQSGASSIWADSERRAKNIPRAPVAPARSARPVASEVQGRGRSFAPSVHPALRPAVGNGPDCGAGGPPPCRPDAEAEGHPWGCQEGSASSHTLRCSYPPGEQVEPWPGPDERPLDVPDALRQSLQQDVPSEASETHVGEKRKRDVRVGDRPSSAALQRRDTARPGKVEHRQSAASNTNPNPHQSEGRGVGQDTGGQSKANKAQRTACELASRSAHQHAALLDSPDAFGSPVASSTLPRGRLVRQLAVPNHVRSRSEEGDDDRGSHLRNSRIPTQPAQDSPSEASSRSAADSGRGRPLGKQVRNVAVQATVAKRPARGQSNWSASEIDRLRYLRDVCALEQLDSCKDCSKLRSAFPGPKAVRARFEADIVVSVAVPSRSTRAVYTKGKSIDWTAAQTQRLRDCLAGIEPAQAEQIISCVRQHPHTTVFTGDVIKTGALTAPEERVQQAFASFDQVTMARTRARGVAGRTAAECLRRMRIIAESDRYMLRPLVPGMLDCLRSYDWDSGWDWAWGNIPTPAEIRCNVSM